jgi:hypothetical protein
LGLDPENIWVLGMGRIIEEAIVTQSQSGGKHGQMGYQN